MSNNDTPSIKELARNGSAEQIMEIQDMDRLRRVVDQCQRCPLAEKRIQGVFGEGAPEADLVCVGEAPGQMEDETGRPFVGPAGKLLDRLLMSVGFERNDVYICNVLKSRPPNNRDPRDPEVQACSPYLFKQIELIDPNVIVTFGRSATQTLLKRNNSLGSMRGTVHKFRGVSLVATYHPAALLRNPEWTRPTWEDLQLAREVLEAGREQPEQEEAPPEPSSQPPEPTQQQLGL